jgi:hypothetical protein
MHTKTISIVWVTTVALYLIASSSPTCAALYWTPWVSEEGGGPASICTAWDEAAVGVGCSGRYCDNVRLLCETLPFNITLDPATDYWTNYFSEEHDDLAQWQSSGWYPWSDENYRICHRTTTAGLVSGITCQGSYCDNVAIECTKPVKYVGDTRYAVDVTNCSWTPWQSEEQGSRDFGWNRYITGVECQGSYCDNKRFYVCSLIDPAP